MNKNAQPWVEKYRPKSLSDIVGQEHITSRLQSFVKDNSMPHLIFSGDAGIGKTTCALALVRDIQKKKMKPYVSYLELNASDSRGIDVVRTDIKDFAKTKPPDGLAFKILILDEFDAMTAPAQQALRRIMETYAKTCRFILICNYSHKIISPIQSRASFIRFNPISDEDVKKRLQFIALNEGVLIDYNALDTIIQVSEGDLRKSVNILQSCSAIDEEITSDIIFSISGHLQPNEIKSIIMNAIDKGFRVSYDLVKNILDQRGLSGKNLIRQMDKEILKLEYEDKIKFEIFKILGETERNISQGATESVQLAAMIVKLTMVKN
jgi:replication factor C small subunit